MEKKWRKTKARHKCPAFIMSCIAIRLLRRLILRRFLWSFYTGGRQALQNRLPDLCDLFTIVFTGRDL
jgi:hypothetical protein